MSNYHTPVLLHETIEGLNIHSGKKYIDATAGGGGHGFEILRRGGLLLAIDQDPSAIENLELRFQKSEFKDHITIVQGNFSEIGEIARANGFSSVSGILFDLGVSSFQLDNPEKGFSFRHDAPLDMRMSGEGETAADIVNSYPEEALFEIIARYGEEEEARQIARAIVISRQKKPVGTTKELAEIVFDAKKRKNPAIHPATRTFQALRVAVNHELETLEKGLDSSLELLKAGGRLAVISFHSLEDRIAKRKMKKWEVEGTVHLITKKPIEAREEEVATNPRSRSAKLRIAEKL